MNELTNAVSSFPCTMMVPTSVSYVLPTWSTTSAKLTGPTPAPTPPFRLSMIDDLYYTPGMYLFSRCLALRGLLRILPLNWRTLLRVELDSRLRFNIDNIRPLILGRSTTNSRSGLVSSSALAWKQSWSQKAPPVSVAGNLRRRQAPLDPRTPSRSPRNERSDM